jgi:hypothetical protein
MPSKFPSTVAQFRCGECGEPHTQMFVMPHEHWRSICGDDYALCEKHARERLMIAGIDPVIHPLSSATPEFRDIAMGWKLPEIWAQERSRE